MKLRLLLSVITALVLVLIAVGFLNYTVTTNRVSGATKTPISQDNSVKSRTKIDYLDNAKRVVEMERPPVLTPRNGKIIDTWPYRRDPPPMTCGIAGCYPSDAVTPCTYDPNSHMISECEVRAMKGMEPENWSEDCRAKAMRYLRYCFPFLRIPPIIPKEVVRSGYCDVEYSVSVEGEVRDVTALCSDEIFKKTRWLR